MTLEGYREFVAKCAEDPELAELTALVLEAHDDTKQRLRDAGFGVLGMGILATARKAVEEVETFKRLQAISRRLDEQEGRAMA